MAKHLFALLVAGALTAPHVTSAWATDTTVGLANPTGSWSRSAGSWRNLPLPPVPYIESMPWLTHSSAVQGSKVDTFVGPKMKVIGPFVVQQDIPTGSFTDSRLSVPSLQTQ
jgi:hypothetical protein